MRPASTPQGGWRSLLRLETVGDQAARCYMAGVVIAYSLIPLIVLAGAGDGPYLFNAFWRLGVLVGCAAILVALHRDALRMLGGGGGGGAGDAFSSRPAARSYGSPP